MMMTELIKLLTEAVAEHGDMPIYDTDGHDLMSITFEEETNPTRAYIEAHF